jgi:hypothetical protein
MALYPRLNFKSLDPEDQPKPTGENLNRWGPSPTEFSFGPDQAMADDPGFAARFPPPPIPEGGFKDPPPIVSSTPGYALPAEPPRAGGRPPSSPIGKDGRYIHITDPTADPWSEFDPTQHVGKNSGGRYYMPTGFPQGANIPPFLSILQLTMAGEPKFAQLVMYADDGLFYSDAPFTEQDVVDHFAGIGIEVSLEKSG